MSLASIQRRLERLELQQASTNISQLLEIKDNEIHFLDGTTRVYTPSVTLKKLHNNDDLVRMVMGPYRSGKSVGLCAEIIFRACDMPACKDNVRRCRVAIVRNTYADLQDTVLNTWLDWYGEFGVIEHHKSPRIFYKHRFWDGKIINNKKSLIELEILFLALDHEKDLRKLKSLEATFIYVNEFSEIPFGFLSHFISRTGCYPSPIMCTESYWRGVFLDTNPPNLKHPMKKAFEIDRPEGFSFYRQPPGLLGKHGDYQPNPEAENINNLPKNYYMDLARGATQEFIKVYIFGQYGSVFLGKSVYHEYNDDLHSADDIDIIEGEPFLIGIDFGLYTPAALVMQAYNGQLRCIKEFVTHDLGIRELFERFVIPYLRKLNTGRIDSQKIKYEIVRDPAGRKSEVEVLEQIGFRSEAAPTNDLLPRLDAVKWHLGKIVDGQAALLVDRQGCPTLREGFLGGYCYKKINILSDEKFRDEPDKNFYSHIHDCLQYGALYSRGLEIPEDQEEEYYDLAYDESTRNPVTGY